MNNTVLDLTSTPIENRDEAWEQMFLSSLPHSYFHILMEQPQKGPDGWPYLLVQLAESPVSSKTVEPAGKVMKWLSDKGIGLAINPTKDTPDYVLTYGMIWNFVEKGVFLSNSKNIRGGQIKFDAGVKVHAGEPSTEYLPSYARNILRSFFLDQKLDAVKILVMGHKDSGYDLCISLESLRNPPAHEHKGILEAISWFLPSHYSLMLVSEKNLPAFSPL